MQNVVKSMPTKGISQFELVNYLLQNLYKWDLTPIEQLVLLQLAYHYNPTNKFVYPKQRTIAQRINVSERSVVRAIQKLVKEGLILIVCGLSNKYVFTSKLTAEWAQNKKIFKQDKISDSNDKITPESDKESSLLIEQKREQNKKQNYFKNSFQKTNYKTGELKRIQEINNEEYEKVSSDYFEKVRQRLLS